MEHLDHEGLKWHGDRPLAAEARQRLIDSGLALLSDGGVGEFTIGRIAADAGVSRPTVYSYFDGRDALLREVLMFAVRGVHVKTARRLEELENPLDIPVEFVVATLQGFKAHRLLRKLLHPSDIEPALAAILTHPDAITDAVQATERLAQVIGWNNVEARESAELISRFAASFLTAPAPRRSEAELRKFLSQRLLPALGVNPTDTPE